MKKFEDKIFETKVVDESSTFKFKYVQIKIKRLNNDEGDEEILIQIIDVSNKILYNEMKAEQVLLTLINAAVSHELRNPLSSLIGQICVMEDFLTSFNHLLVLIKKEDSQFTRKISPKLQKVFNGLQICGKKIVSATQFIDFFVHDILDFSVLNKNDENFTPNNSVFDIREAIQHIVNIQEDKAKMKQIKVRKLFKGFENNNFKVKTDLKRF